MTWLIVTIPLCPYDVLMRIRGLLLLMVLTLVSTAWCEGYWQLRTTQRDQLLNTPGPKASIRGQFTGQGVTIDSSFEDAQGRLCHTTFQATWNWGKPSPVLTPGLRLPISVSTDASQQNWPYPFGAANVWVDDAHKVIEFVRTQPAGPQHSPSATLEIPPGDPEGKKELRIGLFASHAGDMNVVHIYDWKTGVPPASPQSQVGDFSGHWQGGWSNSLGESGPDSLELQQDQRGNLSGTWSGNVPVSGRCLDATHLQLRGRTATREFHIQGTLTGQKLQLTYRADRLNGTGSYTGQSTFTR